MKMKMKMKRKRKRKRKKEKGNGSSLMKGVIRGEPTKCFVSEYARSNFVGMKSSLVGHL